MLKKLVLISVPLVALAGCQDAANSPQGSSRDEIRIVGSSTVYPFAKAVAENFVNLDQARPSPILESTGTGGGIELFCNGIGAATPDIVNASRRIKQGELQRCAENGVTDVVELIVGIDGIAIAQSIKATPLSLSVKEFYEALAATPYGAASNDKAKWSDVSAALPAHKINVYGPPSSSGTREAVTELVMEPGCMSDAKIVALKNTDKDAFNATCHDIRTDGAYVETGENDNLIIQKLKGNPQSIGIFGYSYLEENVRDIRGIAINGVTPTYDNIASGAYPGARPLYVYVKKAHMDVIPGLREFVLEFLKAGAKDSYLAKTGLISSPDDVRAEMMKRLNDSVVLNAADLK